MILRLIIVACAALLVAATVRVAWQQPTPGPLSNAHASLDGAGQCDTCHDGPETTTACLDCHTEIAAASARGEGWHHTFAAGGQTECTACHGEHYGAAFHPLNDRSWTLAAPDGFDHQHVAFGLGEAHASLECERCHRAELATAAWPTIPGTDTPRAGSYLGLVQDCAACHDNVHGEGFDTDCASCHGQAHFTPAAGFDHAAVFALRGAHAEAACQGCHEQAPRFAPPPATDCASCHESPHAGPNEAMFGGDCRRCHDEEQFGAHHYALASHSRWPLEGGHAEATCLDCHREFHGSLAGVPAQRCEACHDDPHAAGHSVIALADTGACARCHSAGTWRADAFARQRHLEIGFPLAGDHGAADCAGCHVPGRDLAGVTLARCDACHSDPHATPFRQDCASCHLFDGGEVKRGRSRMTAAAHALSNFALKPPHAGLDCRQCHGGGTYHERFPGREASDCAACHKDVHAGQFEPRGHACADCHGGLAFKPSRIDGGNHAAFPLEGSHQAVACVTCHTADPATGVRRFVGTPQDCRACHENPHGEEFTAPIRRDGCTGCHTPEDWKMPGFDHDTTGYPLTGAHRRADCASCHSADASGRRVFAGTSRGCVDCHDDPHLGQLTGPRQGDCNRCHGSTERWLPTSFDHDRDSRYHLEGVHRTLACGQCHQVEEFADGARAVRFRPLGMECRDCHEVE